MLTCSGRMFQRRQFPLGPWWHRRTLACQEQAMESQSQTADVQLEETKMQECQTTLPSYIEYQFPMSSVGDQLKCDFMHTLLNHHHQMKAPVFAMYCLYNKTSWFILLIVFVLISLSLLNHAKPKSQNTLSSLVFIRNKCIQLESTII